MKLFLSGFKSGLWPKCKGLRPGRTKGRPGNAEYQYLGLGIGWATTTGMPRFLNGQGVAFRQPHRDSTHFSFT